MDEFPLAMKCVNYLHTKKSLRPGVPKFGIRAVRILENVEGVRAARKPVLTDLQDNLLVFYD